MSLAALTFLFKNPVVQKIVEIGGKYTYKQLSNKYQFYSILEDLGIEKPTDDHERLYVHTTVLFSAKGKQSELIKLLLLKDSQQAFLDEIRNGQNGAFLRQLDHALHTQSFVREIKHWQQIPAEEAKDFVDIYQDLVSQVASPVQHQLIEGNRSLNSLMKDQHRESQENFRDLKQELLDIKSSIAQIVPVVATSPETAPVTAFEILQQEYERQITEIIKTLNQGKVRRAMDEFLTLKTQLWDKLSPVLQFKLLTNLGVAYFQLQEEETAAPLLIEAHELDPESKLGWSNVVNAYLSIGDTANAESHVDEFICKFPDSKSAYAALIKLKAKDHTTDEILTMVPEGLRDSVEIVTALGLAARQRDELKLSIELLRQAKTLKPDDRYINQQLLQSWLEVLARDYRLINLQVLTGEDKTMLEELLAIVYKEQALTDVHESPFAKANLYLAEGFVLFLLKRRSDASAANLKGLEIDPESQFLRKQQGLLLAFSGDLNGAIEMLSKITDYDRVPDVPLLLSEIYRNAGRYDEAIELVESYRAQATDEIFLKQSKYVLVDLYIRRDQNDKITQFESNFSKDDIVDLISLARIQRYRKSPENTISLLKDAIKLASGDSTFRERFLLGEELYRNELFEDAITVFETISDGQTPSEINQFLGRAYRKTGRIADLTRLLRQLREHNGPLMGYTEEEVDIYLYDLSDYHKAQQIAQAYTEKFPSEFGMQLQLNGINIRLENYAGTDTFFDKPIKLWELTHNWVKIYLNQLIRQDRRQQAFEIAYEYRRLKNNEEAHVLFLQTALQHPNGAEAKFKPEAVGKGCVVTLTDRSRNKYILIIEDRPDTELLENEINPGHPKFQKLENKKIGDIVQFDNSFTKWEITSLDSKYTYAFRESQDKCATIYSETSPLRVFNTDDLNEVLGQVVDPNWSKNFQMAQDYYRSCQITLGSFAEAFNYHPMNLWAQLRSIKTVGIRTCDGQSGRLENNSKLLERKVNKKAKKKTKVKLVRLCADLLGMVTLFELPIIDIISQTFGKLLITESTWDSLLQFQQDVQTFSAQPNERLEALLDFVRNHCEIRQPKQLMQINSLEKGRLDDVIGRPFHETMLLAAEYKAILYTEDQALANLAKTEHKVDSTWSQGLAHYFLGNGSMDVETYEATAIQLTLMNYKHTYVSRLTLQEALRKYGAGSREFNTVLEVMQGNTTSMDTAIFVVYGFIADLWRRNMNDTDPEAEEITYLILLHYLTDRTVIDALSLLQRLALIGYGAPNTRYGQYIYRQIEKQIQKVKQNFDCE
jgi:tetratricopeptide (TPR) repeat protein